MSLNYTKQLEYFKKSKNLPKNQRKSLAKEETKEELVELMESNVHTPLLQQSVIVNEMESDFTNEIKQIFKVKLMNLPMK